ncbi:tetratricopeptide (TPR) repeat protein [Lewinella aquimaris]|uniref:Tetratricopeptide (TPR) repeat protein n=1 Tax=Neolewinella aquimaris TaxID=1835722 RepID=A0A840E521_9BACT|nr:hypothetical protein [Neolewinella aquimaris]MBB4079043.1 tetratricopeptide (TPR) repeat protein [Neolewinella aquimaris]
MNNQSILRYLEQPALLSEVSMEELLQLASDYPYAPNVRLLVVMKARQDHDPGFERYLNRFAAATFDRPHLFDLLEAIKRSEEERGEVLELLELEELELAPLADPFEELPSRLNEIQAPDPVAPRPVPPRSTPSDPVFPSTTPKRPVQPANEGNWIETASAYHAVIQRMPTPPPVTSTPHPEDPARFAEVVRRRRDRDSLRSRLKQLRNLRESGGSTIGGDGETGAVVSETLAALLVKQGQYQNAIRMYRRLSLIYPEKKTIFAGLIKEVKENL